MIRHSLHIFIVLVVSLVSTTFPASAITYQQTDSIAVVRLLQKGKNRPAGENMTLFFANELLGKPYVGRTLEVNPKEDTGRECTGIGADDQAAEHSLLRLLP